MKVLRMQKSHRTILSTAQSRFYYRLTQRGWTNKRRRHRIFPVDERRKHVIGLMAAILSAMHMQRADDLFGMPNGTPITDRIIEASIQWAERIMQRVLDCSRLAT